MEQLMDWVRQIAFFMIFMSVFYQLVPDKKYKSYLKLFASLVLILLTVNPLTELFDIRRQLNFNQDVFAYPREVEEFRLRAEQVQGRQYEDILENYRLTVEEQLKGMAESSGLYVSGCEVKLSGETESFGQVTGVRLTVSYRRLDGSSEGADQTGVVKEIGEIEEVRIPPVRTENGVSETESVGNQDTLELAEQIARLYQLGSEQVTVDLEE